ncbi:MAG TPA: transporter [Terriglobales bacterium]|nr:transporter [Terriglobales bacterium]
MSAKLAFVVVIVLFALHAPFLLAEDQSTASPNCFDTEVISTPSRPTVSNSTDTTRCGVLETEFGWDRQTERDLVHSDFAGGLRLGLTPRLDFHWASTDFLSLAQTAHTNNGFGDTWLGLKYRFSEQRKLMPSFGIFYQVKIPSADNSLGSGRVDHSIAFLASKDLGRVRVDFNVVPFIAGSPAGLNHNTGFVLSDSVAITKKLSLLTEAYGYTRLDRDNPAFSSAMAGLTYQLSRRLIVDGGADFGVSHAAPRRRVFAGFTCAITNVFSRAARSGVM